MNGGLSSSPRAGAAFSLSWRLQSGRAKPFLDVQRIVEVAGPVSEGIALFTKREPAAASLSRAASRVSLVRNVVLG
jgi:hypothetical protein